MILLDTVYDIRAMSHRTTLYTFRKCIFSKCIILRIHIKADMELFFQQLQRATQANNLQENKYHIYF